MADDILDAAQKAINDAAHSAEPVPSPLPPEPVPMPPMPPPPPTPDLTKEQMVNELLNATPAPLPTIVAPPQNAHKPSSLPPKKNRMKGAILALLAILLLTIPIGVYFISQQNQKIADTRSLATGTNEYNIEEEPTLAVTLQCHIYTGGARLQCQEHNDLVNSYNNTVCAGHREGDPVPWYVCTHAATLGTSDQIAVANNIAITNCLGASNPNCVQNVTEQVLENYCTVNNNNIPCFAYCNDLGMPRHNIIDGECTTDSFVAGTHINTPNGPRPIETIKKGDLVYSFEPKTGEIVQAYVEKTITHLSDHYYEMKLHDGTELKVTKRHPIYVGATYESPFVDALTKQPQYKGFEAVSHLNVGDTVFVADTILTKNASMKPTSVASLTLFSSSVRVYNLQTSGSHTYFAENIAVHNKITPDPLTCVPPGTGLGEAFTSSNTGYSVQATDEMITACQNCGPSGSNGVLVASGFTCATATTGGCNDNGIYLGGSEITPGENLSIPNRSCGSGQIDLGCRANGGTGEWLGTIGYVSYTNGQNCGGGGGGGGDDTFGDDDTGDDDTTINPVCQNIKIYKDGVQATPSDLVPGDEVVFAVKGNLTPTKARFRVNGNAWAETTTQNASNEWTLEYTVPEGVTEFVIEGEVFTNAAWR